MVACFLLIVASFGLGVSTAVLTGHPLYLGLLAGWLGPSCVLMAVLLPRVVKGRIEEARHRQRHSHAVETMVGSVG